LDVKCADCWYLAVRRRSDYEIQEASIEIRTQYLNPPDRASGNKYSTFHDKPVCYVAAFHLGSEDGTGLDIVQRDRVCPAFVTWIPGPSPEAHQEASRMESRDRAIQAREDARDAAMRRREDERDAETRAREDARDDAARIRHNEQMELLRGQIADQRGQHYRELIVFGLILGAATIAAGILDGLVSRGVDTWPF
jgi:hypothetical protein